MSPKKLWAHILTHWDDITSPDLHQVFGIDTELSWDRPWWWMRSRIFSLLDAESRLAASIHKL